jgi:internalin A
VKSLFRKDDEYFFWRLFFNILSWTAHDITPGDFSRSAAQRTKYEGLTMLNETDLKKLNQLEKKLGKKLLELPIEDILDIFSGYSGDDQGNLIILNLNNLKLADISFLGDFDFPRLSYLKLAYNQITDLSPLQHLTNLTTLYLYNNLITDLSPLLPLKKLKTLLVMNNKISQLQEEWAVRDMKIKWELDDRGGLFLEGNPLEFPPLEIARQGDAAVRNYFNEIKKESVLLLQAKLLLVGAGAVGKTTLLKKLQKPEFKIKVGQGSTTRGIDIVPWRLVCTFANGDTHPVQIHAWDFGGQDILYATHQFFLTKRSLYLFVWEARQEGQETASFDYWLNIIKLLGASSPAAGRPGPG